MYIYIYIFNRYNFNLVFSFNSYTCLIESPKLQEFYILISSNFIFNK